MAKSQRLELGTHAENVEGSRIHIAAGEIESGQPIGSGDCAQLISGQFDVA